MKNLAGPIEKILEGLEEQSCFLTADEIKDELRDRGVDVEGLILEARALIDRHLKAERTSWMQEADRRRSLIGSAAAGISSWLTRSEAEIRAAFVAFANSGPAVAFRNQGDLSVEDMARILDKQEILKKTPRK